MIHAPISATTVADDSERTDEAQETAPLLDAARLEKLGVYNRLPEEVKAKLKTYGAFQTHTNVELHRMLNDIRNEFIIPPWHPFTWFIKKESEGSISGNELLAANRWIVRNNELSDYYEDPIGVSSEWVRMRIDVFDTKAGKPCTPAYVAVDVKRGKIWNYATECFVSGLTLYAQRPDEDKRYGKGGHVCVAGPRMIKYAKTLIASGKTSQDTDNVLQITSKPYRLVDSQYVADTTKVAAPSKPKVAVDKKPKTVGEDVFAAASRYTISRTDALLIRGLVKLGGTLIPSGGEDLVSAAMEALNNIIGTKETTNEN